ncbi:MAG: hypothetical protein WCK51_10810 [Armatimonadota bacterium]
MLQLEFRKNETGAMLVYTRPDGTSTWSKSGEFFVLHDLVHLAVESAFGFKEAFFGLIAQGRTILSFEDKVPGSHEHQQLPDEAYLAELIVGHLDNMRHSPEPHDYPLDNQIRRSASEANLALSEGYERKLHTAVIVMSDLHQEWRSLPVGQALKKSFPLPIAVP